MTPHLLKVALLSTPLLMSPAFASAGLAKQKACMACHAVATKLVGPSLKAIAEKYAADKGAPAALAVTIRKGSTGVWGPMAMPANPQVSEAEATTLATWILSQK